MKVRIAPKTKSAAIAIMWLAGVVTLPADTITVPNTNDSGPGSLRQALADANDGDTIDFAVSGSIALTSGELVVDKSITISGDGPAQLAIDGNATYRVFHISPGKTVSISGLTIKNGNASEHFPDDYGGGIYNDHATLTVHSCVISGNSSFASLGGGIYCDGSNGNVSLEVNASSLVNNFASEGGAIFIGGNEGIATLEINDSVVSGNWGNDGGGIFNWDGTATLQNCTISTNTAGDWGGGINNDGENQGTATLNVINSTLSSNSALSGGGIYNDGQASGDVNLQIVNSTLSTNSATFFGGGIANNGQASGSATVHINNSTFSDNSAKDGGGSIVNFAVYGVATVDLANTVFAAGGVGGNIANDSGTVTSLGYNISSDDAAGYLNSTGDQINSDPLLGPLQDNGGPTFSHELLNGSPAIDAGDPGFSSPPFYDQRGPDFFRVRNSRIDIGSFEVQIGSVPRAVPRARPTPHPRPTPP